MHESGQHPDLAGLTDEALLARVGGGDRAAFMALYDRFSPRIYGLLVKLMRSRTDAEDTLQIVALDIWRRAGGYDPALSSAAMWVLMVTRSRGIDAIRKRGRTESAGGETVEDRAIGREDNAAGAAETHLVSGVLSHLTDEQRMVVHLAFYRGLTREQIAGTLGIPVGTVKTRIRSAVKRLGEMIGEGRTHA